MNQIWRITAPNGGKLEFKIDNLDIESESLNCANGYLQITEPDTSGYVSPPICSLRGNKNKNHEFKEWFSKQGKRTVLNSAIVTFFTSGDAEASFELKWNIWAYNQCDQNPNPCDENQICTDGRLNDSFECTCKDGLVKNKSGKCVHEVRNRCVDGTHTCNEVQTCVDNRDGTFFCKCRSIYFNGWKENSVSR